MGRETGETARCTDHHSGHRLVRGDRRRSSDGRLQFVPRCAEPADATRNVGCAGRFWRPGAHPDYRPQQPIPRRFPGLDCAIRAYAVADGSHAGTTIIPSNHARSAGSALAPTPARNSKADLLAGWRCRGHRSTFLLRCAPLTHPKTCYTSSVILGLGVSPMRRRDFITLVGGAAAWPLAARAQQPGKLPTIGLLVAGTPSSHGPWVAGFVQRLRELGWLEGRTIAIEYRWAEGRSDRAAEIAAEFVRRNVDVIVTSATAVIVAAMQATSVIPIVFAAAGDPVGTGLVASLARPGGNVTGLSIQQTDLAAKRLELLREVVPGLRRLAILANVGGPAVVLGSRLIKSTIQEQRRGRQRLDNCAPACHSGLRCA